jgi:hypothetical protein
MPDDSQPRPHPLFANSRYSLDDIRQVKRHFSSRYLVRRSVAASRALLSAITADPALNVVGVGIGEKISDQRHTGMAAVKLYVRAKLPASQINQAHMMPREIDGIPTDVEETGILHRFTAAAAPPTSINPRTKMRPAQPGCSVGFDYPTGDIVMAGTFGAVVRDSAGVYILSNNHVLADEGQLAAGAPIYQSGLMDDGDTDTDQIASLSRFVQLELSAPNAVDAAIAAVANPADVSNSILFIGQPSGTADAQIDMPVHKFGRTTGYTVGQVSSVDTDVTVQYETGNYTFHSQIIVLGLNGTAFSGSGDSGSLVVSRASSAAVGLLFAGGPQHTVVNHIAPVLSALNVTLV